MPLAQPLALLIGAIAARTSDHFGFELLSLQARPARAPRVYLLYVGSYPGTAFTTEIAIQWYAVCEIIRCLSTASTKHTYYTCNAACARTAKRTVTSPAHNPDLFLVTVACGVWPVAL